MIIIIIIIIIYRSLVAARSPPVSIARPDGKCPDLMTMHMVPWSLSLGRGEVPLCVDTFCPSIEQEPGKKLHIQNPKSEEVRPPQLCLSVSAVCNGDWRFHIGPNFKTFLLDLGRRLRMATGEPRSYAFLLQRISCSSHPDGEFPAWFPSH